jgi:hypothetical protein
MTDLKLRKWDTAVANVRYLANQSVVMIGRQLVYMIEDLETKQSHQYTFKGVLGFRHQTSFNAGRIGNAFVVDPSDWLLSMSHEPFRTISLESAVHYLINSMDGEFEVVAMEPPSHKCIDSG